MANSFSINTDAEIRRMNKVLIVDPTTKELEDIIETTHRLDNHVNAVMTQSQEEQVNNIRLQAKHEISCKKAASEEVPHSDQWHILKAITMNMEALYVDLLGIRQSIQPEPGESATSFTFRAGKNLPLLDTAIENTNTIKDKLRNATNFARTQGLRSAEKEGAGAEVTKDNV